VAAHEQKAPIPDDIVALAARNIRAQIVVDSLPRHTAQRLHGARVPRND
jgi:hypothetical protein